MCPAHFLRNLDTMPTIHYVVMISIESTFQFDRLITEKGFVNSLHALFVPSVNALVGLSEKVSISVRALFIDGWQNFVTQNEKPALHLCFGNF